MNSKIVVDYMEGVNKVIAFCENQSIKGKSNQEIKMLYLLACRARFNLLGRTLDEATYKQQYETIIRKAIEKYQLTSSLETILNSMKQEATTTNGWDNSEPGIEVPYSHFWDLNNRLRPIITKNNVRKPGYFIIKEDRYEN